MQPNFLYNIFHCVKTFELESLPETGEITPAMTTIYNIFHCVKIFELESLPENRRNCTSHDYYHIRSDT